MATNPISTLPAAQTVVWTGRSSIASGADGYIELKDSAGTGFTALRLGGATSSFPMLKRSSADIHARLADDSAFANFSAANVSANGTIAAATSITASTSITAGASSSFTISGRSKISSSADGYLELKDSAGTAFTGLRFGGTSSSFPMLKRSSATLQARLADDSGYADVAVGGLTANGNVGVVSGYHAAAYNLGGPGDSNYERLELAWSSNEARLQTANGGTGAANRALRVMSTGGQMTLQCGSGWNINSYCPSGDFQFSQATGNAFCNVDAAHVFAHRNSTNAQTLRVYRTWTNSTNYERVALQTGSGYGELAVQSAGTGTANMDLALTPAGTGNLKFGTHSAIGSESITGYITIKDSGGTTRKLAVVS